MIYYSPRVQELYGPSEYIWCLEDLMTAFVRYDEILISQNRTCDEFRGNETRWSSNYNYHVKSIIYEKMNNGDPRYADLDSECEFNKKSKDYARDYCHCEDEEVINHFKEMLKSPKHKHDVFFPDIIVHSPGNMRKQLCYIEVKEEHNKKVFSDFDKLTRFKNACLYLAEHIDDEDIKPVFCFHIFILIGISLKKKIQQAHEAVRTELRVYDRDIICIYKEDNDNICTTLGEILDEIAE